MAWQNSEKRKSDLYVSQLLLFRIKRYVMYFTTYHRVLNGSEGIHGDAGYSDRYVRSVCRVDRACPSQADDISSSMHPFDCDIPLPILRDDQAE